MKLLWAILVGILTANTTWAKEPAPEIVFPPSPAQPRIKYLFSLATMKDVKSAPDSSFKKMINFLTGRKDITAPVLGRPYGVCSSQNRIYVTDTSTRLITIFDRVNENVYAFGNALHTQLTCPIGVAIDNQNRTYVTDSEQNVIKTLGPDGKHLLDIGVKDKLQRPTGIVFDAPRDRLLVADTGNSRILAYDLRGNLLTSFGKRGFGKNELGSPVNLAVDSNGRIYVVDPLRCHVQVFSSAGKFIFAFGEQGDGPGYFSRPRGIAIDSYNNVYVTDALFNTVQMFNDKGEVLMFFGTHGNQPGNFLVPAGIHIDKQNQIYVVDSLNHRIQVFQLLPQNNDSGARNSK